MERSCIPHKSYKIKDEFLYDFDFQLLYSLVLLGFLNFRIQKEPCPISDIPAIRSILYLSPNPRTHMALFIEMSYFLNFTVLNPLVSVCFQNFKQTRDPYPISNIPAVSQFFNPLSREEISDWESVVWTCRENSKNEVI